MGEIGEYWRDVKQNRRKRKREDPQRRRCWDWIVSTGTSCHYAKNRSMFTTYRRVPPGIVDKPKVIGIGTVELRVPHSPGDTQPPNVLVLKNFLHVPDAVCNGFNPMFLGGRSHFGKDVLQTRDDSDQPTWYATFYPGKNLYRLAIAGIRRERRILKRKVLTY